MAWRVLTASRVESPIVHIYQSFEGVEAGHRVDMAAVEIDFQRPEVEDIEALRKANIQRNRDQLKELGIFKRPTTPAKQSRTKLPPNKKRKLSPIAASRSSVRIANAPAKPSYNEDDSPTAATVKNRKSKAASSANKTKPAPPEPDLPKISADISTLQGSWASYERIAPPPTRSEDGSFHFLSHPTFTPNKSPEEMLREGVFGGYYFRPIFSSHLRATVANDWTDIPESWYSGLDTTRFLTSPSYDPEVNKYKVKCGQSIEEWEAAGWIDHHHDPRGWFQWYCRFFLGRRCEDDERQVGRWDRCVGVNGRWRRMLLKKYMQMGVRECFDYGDQDEDGGESEVSPVMHQTCFQWGYEIKQADLDRYWDTGK